ncbi:MAG: hypothetical protein QXW00_03880 [Candidatus Woesearchaeota archaeon]
MFNLFKRKNSEEVPNQQSANEDLTAPAQTQQTATTQGQENLAAELMKIKAEVEAFSDVRKATNEKLTRLSEQIGELRAMIADRDKVMNQIEVKATKAADLVATVKPEEQMVEIKRQDAKLEAFKASLESNELLMKRVLDELKEMRTKIASFRGIEELINLNNEVKSEIIEIKKVEANIQKHADKVETIFAEVQKRFVDFTKIDDRIASNTKQIAELSKNLDGVKATASAAATKKSVDELTSKFLEMKDQLSELVSTINKRLSLVEKNNSAAFEAFEKAIMHKFKLSKEEVAVFKEQVQQNQQAQPTQQISQPQDVSQKSNTQEQNLQTSEAPEALPQPQASQQVQQPQSEPNEQDSKKPDSSIQKEIREAAKFAKRIKSKKRKKK